ncbi:MAG TPA: hypothetical protein VGI24_10535 [Solirubrobacteraceae bacterium]|jgi:hypothetical protein
MRSSRLVPAIVAAASLLAPTIAGARPHKHSNPSGRCNVALNVAPRQITAGDSVLAFGRLRCTRRANAVGQAVQLWEHPHGTAGYTLAQSTTTDARGFYELTQSGVQSNVSFYVRAHRAQSATRHVKVAAQVTVAGPPEGTQLLTGRANQVTFTGTVNPADVGARVTLQRQNALTGNEWRRIDRGTVGAGGTVTIVHRFRVPGDANLRVIVRSDGVNIPSSSNVLTYEVSQAQNPQLTIAASSDPISYGQSVTISGTASGVLNAPVTLLARTVHQHGFAPVAEVSTSASGEYAFPAQSPVNSTLYEVTAAHPLCKPPRGRACSASADSSAVLYEGVKDVLTATVSQSAIQAGQTLTFTGTVAPDHTGHIIYLERENVGNGNFHVVEVAAVGSGSVYSIPHTVYTAGTKIYRVRIPGGPENEGASSAPFTIQVTPAPAAALVPEGPGNSGLPAEGEQ